jgi:ABC-type cobalamin/Fe3+-siderophores transport system ATPase subunit
MQTLAVSISQLTVKYGDRLVLDIPDLVVEKGSVLAIMGPNGCGKTTLLRSCLGFVHPASGTIAMLGENICQLRGSALARLRCRIGYVPQLLPTHGEMPLTVREVVAIARSGRVGLFQRLSINDWQIIDRWIQKMGLAPLSNRAFSEISGGEKRKTIIARAMAQKPELLLMDEPTANLDLGWRENIVAIIDRLQSETGIAIVLVCHELEALPSSCRRVILLQNGRPAGSGAPEEVFRKEQMIHLFGPGLRAVHFNGRHAVLPEGGIHA